MRRAYHPSVRGARLVAVISVVAAALAGHAGAATPTVATDTSTNWAGYTLTDTATAPVSFTRATATWRQPALTCGAGASRSAIWVGLGGVNPDSGELEQLGTNGNCTAGKPQYSAFYDVIPNPGSIVKRFPVRAGDIITATVSTEKGGGLTKFRMVNLTSKLGVAGTLPVDPGERRSAEWIVEAPEGCNNTACAQADLANFGSVSFTKVATVGNGHTGTILDPRWQTTAESLRPPLAQIAATGLSHGAVPTPPSAGGSAFKVDWRGQTAAAILPPPQRPTVKKKPSPYIAGPRSSH
jgi:hypothetical protein